MRNTTRCKLKGGEMRSKLFIGLICTMLIVPFVNAQPKVKLGGLFYVYSFMWKNADFNGDTDDGDQHFYLHGDLHGTADFGKGISAKVKIGDWGTFGRHSIFGTGPDGLAVPSWYYGWDEVGVHIMEAYLMASNLWDSPFGLQVGKQHVLYGDGMVAFDGGEDGFMGGKLFYNHEMFDMDLFWYRLIEGGGTSYIGSGMTNIPDDLDLFGAYGTLKLMEGGIHLSPYWFWRTESWKYAPEAKDTVYSDNPMWLGGRVESLRECHQWPIHLRLLQGLAGIRSRSHSPHRIWICVLRVLGVHDGESERDQRSSAVCDWPGGSQSRFLQLRTECST